MALNSKVKEQAERAEKIHREVYGTEQKEPEQKVEENKQEAQPEVVQPVEEPVTPVMEQSKAPPQEEDAWEHRYKVLSGKYSAEVPRLAEEIRALKAEIVVLQESAKEKTKAPDLNLKDMTPEAVVEQFGEDFAAAVGAIAQRIAQQQGKQFREEFEPKVELVRKTTAQAQRAEFMRTLETIVPDWKEIDVDAGFTAFLDEVDPLSGKSRREYFNDADSTNNASRIANFFTAYKATKVPPKPVKPVESRISIESQIAPSTSQRAESVPGKKFWTQADVRRFYQDMRRGLIGVDEGRRIESDILAAAQEGRMAA